MPQSLSGAGIHRLCWWGTWWAPPATTHESPGQANVLIARWTKLKRCHVGTKWHLNTRRLLLSGRRSGLAGAMAYLIEGRRKQIVIRQPVHKWRWFSCSHSVSFFFIFKAPLISDQREAGAVCLRLVVCVFTCCRDRWCLCGRRVIKRVSTW